MNESDKKELMQFLLFSLVYTAEQIQPKLMGSKASGREGERVSCFSFQLFTGIARKTHEQVV